MSTPSTTNPWEETITWRPVQPVEPGEIWLVCTDDGQVGHAFMAGLDWYWATNHEDFNEPITARVARMARMPIGPPLPFHVSNEKQPTGIDAKVCKVIHTENVSEEGEITDGCGNAVATFYSPCVGILNAVGYLRVVCDYPGHYIETRVEHSTLVAAGWTPPSQAREASPATSGSPS